ncbi:MAG: hypothetical protein WC822_04940 [Candidatus Paceibacterota bacterium]|jgi:hypothetical protein
MEMVYALMWFLVGAFAEFLAIWVGLSWVRGQQAHNEARKEPKRALLAENKKVDVAVSSLPVPAVVAPAVNIPSLPPAIVEMLDKTHNPVPVVNAPSLHPAIASQHFWYFVQGQDKPLPTLRQALMLFPVEFAKYGKQKNLDYTALPQHIQDSIRREPIVRKKK